jgi:AraC-like DNA-binding protein
MNRATETFSSFAEYAQSAYAENCVLETRLEGSQAVSLVKTKQEPGAYPDPPVPDFSIQYIKRANCLTLYDLGDGYFEARTQSGCLAIIPPDTSTDFQLEGSSELQIVAIPKVFVASVVKSSTKKTFTDFGDLHSKLHHDTSLACIVERLHRPSTLAAKSALLVDSLTMALVQRLLRLSSASLPRRDVPALDKALLGKVEAYLQERLAENPTLDELATLADMSTYEFAKRFKVATGLSPYQYVLLQRLERSLELLEATRLPLAEVAYSVGFSSQAHMNSVFKERFGYTPRAYRNGLN